MMTNALPNDASAAQPVSDRASQPRPHHVCPWWVGYLLASPLRRLVENPDTIVASLIEPGGVAVDVGSAMGFFSLALARRVGPDGRVICLDVQQRMLRALERRAQRRRLDGVIETRLCSQHDLGVDDLAAAVDLVLAIHVVHESAYPARFLAGCAALLRPAGRLLIAEPRGHVSQADWNATVALIRDLGLAELDAPALSRSHAALLTRAQ